MTAVAERTTDTRSPRDRLADHLPSLRAFAISLCRNGSQADDLVQETILKAWSNIEKFDPATNLEAWLFTILRNTFYSSLRKTRREAPTAMAAMPRPWSRRRPMMGALPSAISSAPSMCCRPNIAKC